MLLDFETAPVREELRAALRYLKRMAQEPENLTAADARELRAAGVSKQAALDAIAVGFCFNLIVRLSDSFDFDVPSPERFAKLAPMMMKRGYAM